MSAEIPAPPRITILLCTYNGAAHLNAQLASYVAQDHDDWDLWVSDDHSTDDTWQILQAFQKAEGHRRTVRLLRGPGKGGTINFLSLLCHPDLPDGPVCLSDQDDVWLPHKLHRALDGINSGGSVTLYGAQYHHTDADLTIIGVSRLPRHAPSFPNALTQNIVSGHSATLSAGALQLARSAGVPKGVPYHDWWLYQLITGAGGDVVIDTELVLKYRQHDNNVMGANQGLRATLERIGQVFGHTYGGWLQANMAALRTCENLLTPENQAALKTLTNTPVRPGLARPYRFRQQGLYRQTALSTLCLYLAAALGRV